ncbi:MAG: site-specific integrase, partial [Planctomycetaceae bacterium]|nr:site-specific integrase [Planctomycetaceae bacterium]
MASLIRDKDGKKRIGFNSLDGRPMTLWLGKCADRVAIEVQRHVEAILSAAAADVPVDPRTADWLGRIGDDLHRKLASKGLVAPRQTAKDVAAEGLLGPFLATYIASRSDVKPLTLAKYETARRELVAFFGFDKPLVSVSQGDADSFRRHLATGRGNRPRAENTVRKIIANAKVFFGGAKRLRLIPENPFADQKASILANSKRMVFVSRETIDTVISACPNAYWRLIVTLARYGGLRIPSELAITWDDVDWERGRLLIRSPKTAHHHGRDERMIPLFPEVRTALDEVWQLA